MQSTANLQACVSSDTKMIAIASGKGGVGKTWFSITLTYALSHYGRKCLLFDGDLGLANIDIQLGLMPKRDLSNVVAGHITLKQSCYHYEEGKFDVIAGRSGIGNFATLPPMKVIQIRNDLSELAQSYDHLLIDLGAGVDRTMRLLSSNAQHYIVVTNAEPTSLTDAYAFIKLTLYEHPEAQFSLLINNAESVSLGQKTYHTMEKACQEFLGYKLSLMGIVRKDRRVSESIRYQSPIIKLFPHSYAATDVLHIAKKILKTP